MSNVGFEQEDDNLARQVLDHVDGTLRRRGWWSQHEYKRNSVERDVRLGGWIGWERFSRVIGSTNNDRNRKLVLSTFKMGGRIGEILGSKHTNFKIEPAPDSGIEYLLCDMIPLEKHWKKLSETKDPSGKRIIKTEKVPAFRTFALPIDDVVEPYSREFADFATSSESDWLFPSPYRKRAGMSLTRVRAYQIVHYEMGLPLELDLYNHLFRAWRASQLRRERKFGLDDLMEFFQWRDYKTALIYAKKGVWGIAERFGNTS